jgi:hypothetical protein
MIFRTAQPPAACASRCHSQMDDERSFSDTTTPTKP